MNGPAIERCVWSLDRQQKYIICQVFSLYNTLFSGVYVDLEDYMILYYIILYYILIFFVHKINLHFSLNVQMKATPNR